MATQRPSPTGSGAASISPYESFLQALTDAVEAHREARLIKYQLQRLQREHKKLGRSMDDLRLARLSTQLEQPRELHRIALRDQDAEIGRMQADFERTIPAITDLEVQNRKTAIALRQRADRVYALESRVSNDVFRQDAVLPMPPALLTTIRLGRAGIRLLEDDRTAETEAESELRVSLDSLHNKRSLVQLYIDLAAHEAGIPSLDLPGAMTDLQRHMENHRSAIRCRDAAKARADRRQQEQLLYEGDMFLDEAAPILEADGRISPDRLRYSVVERTESGERFIYRNSAESRLTDAQRDDLSREARAFYDEIERRKGIAKNLQVQWTTHLEIHPTSRDEGAGTQLKADLLVADEMVTEMETATQQLMQVIGEATDIEKEYDFPSEAGDGRVDSEGSPAQARRLASMRPAVIDDWVRGVVTPNSNDSTPALSLTASEQWDGRPIEWGDQAAYDYYFLSQHERWVRRFLLARWRRWEGNTRRGIAVVQLDNMSDARFERYTNVWRLENLVLRKKPSLLALVIHTLYSMADFPNSTTLSRDEAIGIISQLQDEKQEHKDYILELEAAAVRHKFERRLDFHLEQVLSGNAAAPPAMVNAVLENVDPHNVIDWLIAKASAFSSDDLHTLQARAERGNKDGQYSSSLFHLRMMKGDAGLMNLDAKRTRQLQLILMPFQRALYNNYTRLAKQLGYGDDAEMKNKISVGDCFWAAVCVDLMDHRITDQDPCHQYGLAGPKLNKVYMFANLGVTKTTIKGARIRTRRGNGIKGLSKEDAELACFVVKDGDHQARRLLVRDFQRHKSDANAPKILKFIEVSGGFNLKPNSFISLDQNFANTFDTTSTLFPVDMRLTIDASSRLGPDLERHLGHKYPDLRAMRHKRDRLSDRDFGALGLPQEKPRHVLSRTVYLPNDAKKSPGNNGDDGVLRGVDSISKQAFTSVGTAPRAVSTASIPGLPKFSDQGYDDFASEMAMNSFASKGCEIGTPLYTTDEAFMDAAEGSHPSTSHLSFEDELEIERVQTASTAVDTSTAASSADIDGDARNPERELASGESAVVVESGATEALSKATFFDQAVEAQEAVSQQHGKSDSEILAPGGTAKKGMAESMMPAPTSQLVTKKARGLRV
ncbi:hypothetical protein LTS12_010260 [Elasticomyces elasticus]|nr:hypothetical protein LTS12_010260 [Elasticomyces elasticus]